MGAGIAVHTSLRDSASRFRSAVRSGTVACADHPINYDVRIRARALDVSRLRALGLCHISRCGSSMNMVSAFETVLPEDPASVGQRTAGPW
jgi:hypothetical protein